MAVTIDKTKFTNINNYLKSGRATSDENHYLTVASEIMDDTQLKNQNTINTEVKTNIASVTTTANSANTTAKDAQTRVATAESKITALETKVTNLGTPAHFKGTVANYNALLKIKGATNGDIYNVTAAIDQTVTTTGLGGVKVGPYGNGTNFIWTANTASTGTDDDTINWDAFGSTQLTINDASTTTKGVVKFVDVGSKITTSSLGGYRIGNDLDALDYFNIYSNSLSLAKQSADTLSIEYNLRVSTGLILSSISNTNLLELKIDAPLLDSNGYISLSSALELGTFEIITVGSSHTTPFLRLNVDSNKAFKILFDPNQFSQALYYSIDTDSSKYIHSSTALTSLVVSTGVYDIDNYKTLIYLDYDNFLNDLNTIGVIRKANTGIKSVGSGNDLHIELDVSTKAGRDALIKAFANDSNVWKQSDTTNGYIYLDLTEAIMSDGDFDITPAGGEGNATNSAVVLSLSDTIKNKLAIVKDYTLYCE